MTPAPLPPLHPLLLPLLPPPPPETHFGSLLNSDAANRIIDKKIDVALARPEGGVLIASSPGLAPKLHGKRAW